MILYIDFFIVTMHHIHVSIYFYFYGEQNKIVRISYYHWVRW